ncbi:BQ5605_C007g04679 [Microbotryum silenes-dioicae]|uniref:BQ5605_C007g04679 protein n=1 Tax=Microbotryum silenes-dioicae TaxID=796604 RepID=A0A2X0MUU6_9BASI|nr:BQ5605_C007g04679 [Microbotryum silenes-dioicae]
MQQDVDSHSAVDYSEASSFDGGEEAKGRLCQVVTLLESRAPNHLQLEYDKYECKLKESRPILELPLYMATEERFVAVVKIPHGAPSISILQHPADHMTLIEWHPLIGDNLQSTWNESRKEIYYNVRPKDKDIECECSSHLKIVIPFSNFSVAMIYKLGDHEGRGTLESVGKPAAVMRTIARQIKVLPDYSKTWEKIHRVTRHPNRAFRPSKSRDAHTCWKLLYLLACGVTWSRKQTLTPPPLGLTEGTEAPPPLPESVPLALKENLLGLEGKPLGSPEVETSAPTPVLIDPSNGTMDTADSKFDPQRTTPLFPRNPGSSPAPLNATIGLMPGTPPMRLQRVVKGSTLLPLCRCPSHARSLDPFQGIKNWPLGQLPPYPQAPQVLADRSARGKNPLSKLRGFAEALHSMSGSPDNFDVEFNCSRSEIVDPKPCHDE